MSLLEDLLESIEIDAPVRQVLVSVHWTVVCSRFCGMASTFTGDQPHGHERVRGVGELHHQTGLELAALSASDNLLEASIGVAALNSLLEVDEYAAEEVNALDFLIERGAGKSVAMVGHFPFVPRLRQHVGRLWVIEKNPTIDEYPPETAPELLSQSDIVAITGSALINHSLEGLLGHCAPGAEVMVLGPSTPFTPILFDYGATILAGSKVVDEAAVLRTVGQGASFPQVQGVRLLTLTKPV
jgi:hypothetical protein